MGKPIIGFAGLTHLGLNSAVASAARGFQTAGFHEDVNIVESLCRNEPHITEHGLAKMMKTHTENLNFSADPKVLSECDMIYIGVDVPTNDNGVSDLNPIHNMIEKVLNVMDESASLIILCQVPPGFTRCIKLSPERIYYQVETLIYGRAVERAMYPERFIIGCSDPLNPIDPRLKTFLSAFKCPIMPMRYESAELAKISINMCLVAAVSTANTLAEICEHIGADWSEIVPALRLDKRIGMYAYLKPGLGIAGGNLERDLSTVLSYAKKHQTDGGVVAAWVNNSNHRKNWAWATLNDLVLKKQLHPKIAVLGLTYKENTHSIKNSPSISLLNRIQDHSITAFDPAAETDAVMDSNVIRAKNAITATEQADVLLVMTPWPEFHSITADDLAKSMTGKIVIDPYSVLDGKDLVEKGFTYATLGEPVRQPIRNT
jgi:UDPglucose 6-dehydrogenase